MKIEPCLCGITPTVSECFGKLRIGCSNKKCKLKPDTWLYAGEVYDVRVIVKYWNDGMEGK